MTVELTQFELLPLLRGALIARDNTPVVLQPSQAEPTVTISADGADVAEVAAAVAAALPTDLSLPATIKVTAGGAAAVVEASKLGGAATVPSSRQPEAGHASSRAGVVAGRVALVTGGAQGFGEEIVRSLHASGAWVFVADLNIDGATRLTEELGERATPIKVNVADEDSVRAMAEQVVATTGGIDLVVSNAGIARAGSVLSQELSAFQLSTEVNYVAFFLVTKHLGQILRQQHVAAPDWTTDIVQINSKSGLVGSNRNAAYAGSKFGGIGLVQSFALELVDHRVKVNAICPGNFLDGPLWSDPDNGLFVQYLRSGKVPGAKDVDDVRRFYESKVPMGRGTHGADVMRALFYIVEQDYETGQALPVTGGQVMLSS
ncbi:SDR family NAD(P)-dependent oxidoreductase [Tessaracoccus rhinocerotis]|uniref:SDR family NAD(P)-dependent oxidoreductase n=1 Tax=Tessaracoccus rhinocerotis TaxID=1689449 RepID=A0A553K670_9ACTN|nr:SDR family NAD(P)-dependent oxidoreductase [Tessaracoccus rhinocerotis]TRY20162.1 SDR family NAD(P)-dependent oxidoreductase [Tessaracoccus rhinocerotis]